MKRRTSRYCMAIAVTVTLGGAVLSDISERAAAAFSSLIPPAEMTSDDRIPGRTSGIGAQDCAPAPVGLVSWWSGDGNALDSRSRNNGTLSGTTFVAGQNGQAFRFAPSNTLTADGSGSLNITGDKITIEAWVKLENNAIHPMQDFVAFVGKNDFPTEAYGFLFESGQIGGPGSGLPQLPANQWQVEYILTNSSGTRVHNQFTNVLVTVDGNYHHFALTYDGAGSPTNNVKIYVDGVLQSTNIPTGPVNTQVTGSLQDDAAVPFTISNRPANSFSMDEVSIYDRALPASEIQSISNAGTAGKCKPTATTAPSEHVGWWAGDGNTTDIAGTNNGTLQNGAGFRVGKVGQSFSFDGVDDSVQIPHNANQNIGATFSAEAWIFPESLPNLFPRIFDKDNLGPTRWLMAISNDVATNALSVNINGLSINTPDGSIPLNQWSHVAFTYNGGTGDLILFVNGVQSASSNIGPQATNNTAPLTIGDDSATGTRDFDGLIDEAAIYSRVLTPGEIASIFNAGLAGKLKSRVTRPSNTLAWYPAEGNANDDSGNSNNGTLQNGAGFAIGRIGQAFSFDGVDDFVSIPDSPSFDFATNEVSVDAWIKPTADTTPPLGGIINQYSSADATFFFALGSADAAGARPGRFIVYGDSTGFLYKGVVTTARIEPNTFTHIAATYKQATQEIKFYINGVETAVTPEPGSADLTAIYNSPLPVHIGRTNAAEIVHFAGLIDEAAVYDRALTAAEINSIFNAGLAGPLEDPYSPEGTGVTVTVGDATVTFPSVTAAGTTQEIPLDPALLQALPAATHTGLVYDIATSAAFLGTPTVCFNLPSFTPTQFADLRVLHLEGGAWVNRTAASNTFPALCTNGLTTLSPFAIVGPPGSTDLTISPTSAAVTHGSLVNFTAAGGTPPRTFSIPVNNSGATINPAFGNYTAGNTAGTDTVRVTDGLGSTAEATVQVFGPAHHLGFVVQPSNTGAGQTITPHVQVAVQDANGNTVANSTKLITLSIENNPSSGTLSGTVARNAVNGIATFNDLSIDNLGNGYTLRAGSSAVFAAISDPFDIAVVPVLEFITQPSNTIQNSGFMTPPVRVAITDGNGNVIPTASALISVAPPQPNPTGLQISGVLSAQTVNGIATFDQLVVSQVGEGHRIVASANSFSPVTSAPFEIFSEYAVLNTNDSGPGSLRQAILNANARNGTDTITFDIPGTPPFTILLQTVLPALTDTVFIDGRSQPGFAGQPIIEVRSTSSGIGLLVLEQGTTIRGLVLNGFHTAIHIEADGPNLIQGNYIGTNVAGNAAMPNANGIVIAGSINNIIGSSGGLNALDRNLISGNTAVGVGMLGSQNTVRGNFIGTNAAGTAAVGNFSAGVLITGDSNSVRDNVISGNTRTGIAIGPGGGEQNLIMTNLIGLSADGLTNVGNGFSGIFMTGSTQTRNKLTRNRIFANGGLGIRIRNFGQDSSVGGPFLNDPGDGDMGANGLQNYPRITGVTSAAGTTTVEGSLNSTPSANYTIEVFSSAACDASGNGEAATFIGSMNAVTDAGGLTSFSFVFPVNIPNGNFITATATDNFGNTSELSQCHLVATRSLISGRVTHGGQPFSNAQVRLTNDGDLSNQTIVTSTDGRFQFSSLPPSDYTLRVIHPNISFLPATRSFPNLSQDHINQDFASSAVHSFSVRGRARTNSQASVGAAMAGRGTKGNVATTPSVGAGAFPLPDVTFDLTGPVVQTIRNDRFGNYTFSGLPPGNYLITPSRPGHVFTPPSTNVTIGTGDVTVDFNGQSALSLLAGRMMYDSAGEIYAMNADGSGVVKLVATSVHSNFTALSPRLSENGRQALYVRQSSTGTQARITSINADGTSPTALLTEDSGLRSPVYSPDGTRIAFNRSTSDDLYTMNADGTGVQLATPNCASPDWSPDSTRVVCLEGPDSNSTRVKIVDLVNSTEITIDSSTGRKFSPRWSPDGTRIAYIRRLSSGANPHSIVVNDPLGAVQSFMVGPNNLYQTLTWSPDSARLAFIRSTTAGASGLRPPGVNNQLVTIQSSDGQDMLVIVDHFTGNRIDWGNSNSLPTPESPTPVTVQSGAVSITFPTSSGANALTTITPIEPNSAGTAPNGFVFGNFAFEISSSNTFTPPITICVDTDLPGVNLLPAGQPALFHNENGVLVNITTSFDSNTGILCGQAGSFSPFVVATEVDPALPSIFGLVLDENGDAMSGVQISLTGAGNESTQTDSDGLFKFVNLISGANYNVQPELAGFIFTEYSQDFLGVTGENTIVFTGAESNFDISGQVVDGVGDPVGGVTISLDGGLTDQTVTDASGNYTFVDLPAGSVYFLIPSSPGFSFNPQQINTGSLISDVAGLDFVRLAPTAAGVSVGGRIMTSDGVGIGSAIVTLSDTGGTVRRAISNPFGYYRFDAVNVGGTYIVTVASKRYVFSNPSQVITVNDELTDVDFEALP